MATQKLSPSLLPWWRAEAYGGKAQTRARSQFNYLPRKLVLSTQCKNTLDPLLLVNDRSKRPRVAVTRERLASALALSDLGERRVACWLKGHARSPTHEFNIHPLLPVTPNDREIFNCGAYNTIKTLFFDEFI